MKKIKTLLFSGSKKTLISLGLSLLFGFFIVLLIGMDVFDSTEANVVMVILIVIWIYWALMSLILAIIGLIKYITAKGRFNKWAKADELYVEDEEFEMIHKNLYVSKNYILSTTLAIPFVLHRAWIDECVDKEIFRGNILTPVIEIKAKNKTFLIQYTMKKQENRENAMKKFKEMLNLESEVIEKPVETTQDNPTVSLTEKQGKLNLITFGMIAVVMVLLFGFGYNYVSERVNYTRSSNSPTATTQQTYRNVDFQENGEIQLTYDIENEETTLYFFNESPYVFKAKLTITTDSSMENIETYWIRPQGYDSITLKNKGEPDQYQFNVELYRELLYPTSVVYKMYASSLTEDYAYDVVFENNCTLEDVREVAIDEGIYSDMENVPELILFFHDLDMETFENESPPEDLSSLRYVVEIDTITQEAVIYEANKEERTEVERFNYEEAYYER